MRQYDGLFQLLSLIPITDDLVEDATVLRARFGLRNADSIHLVSAIRGKADVFLTGDRQLARCTDVNVVVP